MPDTARSAVFLCQGGGRGVRDSVDFKRLRWAAEAEPGCGPVLEIPMICRAEGGRKLAELAREKGLQTVLVGACARAAGSGGWERELAGLGIEDGDIALMELFDPPPDGDETCPVCGDGPKRLSQTLATHSEWQEPPVQDATLHRRVLVWGGGYSALLCARDLAKEGIEVVQATHTRRLAPEEPLLGPEICQQSKEMLAGLEKAPGVELWPRAELLGLAGQAGNFSARVMDQNGEVHTLEVGAVVAAQGPPMAPDFETIGLPGPGESVKSLSDLASLVASPAYLEGMLKAHPVLRVAMVLGMAGESQPLHLRAACQAGLALAAEHQAQVTVFTGNTKVAGEGLEELTQKAKAAGVVFVPLRPGDISCRVSKEGISCEFRDRILEMDLNQNFDLLAMESSPRPDSAYLDLARVLGLAGDKRGSLRPDRVNALPVGTRRQGVFAVGDALGQPDLERRREEAGYAVWSISRLLDPDGAQKAVLKAQVDRKKCALCLTCVRVCPHQAMGRVGRKPEPSPLACVGCGTCAAECPMDAIQLVNLEDARLSAGTKAAVTHASVSLAVETPQEVIAFLCNNSAGQALSAARRHGLALPSGLRLVRVPCAGSVDPNWVLEALKEGLDGVLLVSCFPGSCYSLEGSTWAEMRLDHLKALLDEAGCDSERLVGFSVAPNQPLELMKNLTEALAKLGEMGPNPLKSGARAQDIFSQFQVSLDATYTIMT